MIKQSFRRRKTDTNVTTKEKQHSASKKKMEWCSSFTFAIVLSYKTMPLARRQSKSKLLLLIIDFVF